MALSTSQDILVIEPQKGWLRLDLKSVWEYRELLVFLLWRDVKGNYRQMALGPLWIVLRPLLSVLIFTVIFGGVVRTPTDGLPYPVFFYSALLPWTFFAGALQQSASSLTNNMHLISKVYFPRLVVPIAGTLGGILDAAVSFLVLLGMCLLYGFRPGPGILLLPVYMLLAMGTALAVGLWIASLSVRFRDVTFVLGYVTQAWMYASPVIYSTHIVPARWKLLFMLNPMTQVIDGFRWALLGRGEAPGPLLLLSGALVAVALFTGACHFQRTERLVVDLL
ncbi:MAG TPA: ABC transporter permease [Armatimonadota bacterium]|nr:ABC transporter permease [Armatimonadota bacterium]